MAAAAIPFVMAVATGAPVATAIGVAAAGFVVSKAVSSISGNDILGQIAGMAFGGYMSGAFGGANTSNAVDMTEVTIGEEMGALGETGSQASQLAEQTADFGSSQASQLAEQTSDMFSPAEGADYLNGLVGSQTLPQTTTQPFQSSLTAPATPPTNDILGNFLEGAKDFGGKAVDTGKNMFDGMFGDVTPDPGTIGHNGVGDVGNITTSNTGMNNGGLLGKTGLMDKSGNILGIKGLDAGTLIKAGAYSQASKEQQEAEMERLQEMARLKEEAKEKNRWNLTNAPIVTGQSSGLLTPFKSRFAQ